jgi:hypothetical protein
MRQLYIERGNLRAPIVLLLLVERERVNYVTYIQKAPRSERDEKGVRGVVGFPQRVPVVRDFFQV